TYQVNYTLRLQTKFSGDARALFWRLARAQSSGYAALIDTGRHIICSASPELFFARNGLHIEMRPMKGTAPRGCTTAEDAANIRWLEASVKNRAENVMIVDMIRNDLSVTADPGTVCVPRLFTVEKYPTVLQMTSTVTAQTGVPTPDLFSALFPCASITGAPKVRTMQIISELETSPRGVYTGCVGFMLPGRQAQFNVAIRTVCIDRATRTAEYGVGSGIVWDSDTAEEYEECQTKAQVLAADRPEFDLLETLLWEPGSGYFLAAAHVARMVDSAGYFDFAVTEAQLWHKLEQAAHNLGEQPCRVRLLASRSGRILVQSTPLAQSALPRRFSVALAPSPVDSKNPFLYHKTTHRQVYRRAQAAHPAADDVLLWNERGQITESCIANVVVRFGNRLVTPPVGCGLLAGTYRGYLLAQQKITEQVVTLDDLKRADQVYLINSVRRWIDVLPLFDTQEMPFASF
ncbi:MAG: aminodeoxychorismate synthase, component I, partial [Chloroflexi bacterium]